MTTYISQTEQRKWTKVSRCLIKIKPKSDSKYWNWISHFIFDIIPLSHNEKARFTLVIWISLRSNVTVFRQPKSDTLSEQSSGFTQHSLLMRGTRIFKLAIFAFHKTLRLRTKPCENEFYLHVNEKSFSDINGFALSLALRKSLGATRKWRIARGGGR